MKKKNQINQTWQKDSSKLTWKIIKHNILI